MYPDKWSPGPVTLNLHAEPVTFVFPHVQGAAAENHVGVLKLPMPWGLEWGYAQEAAIHTQGLLLN